MEFGYQGITGPKSSEDWHSWHANLKLWREEQRLRMGYSDKEYARPGNAWLRSDFVQVQMMVEDCYFFDRATNRYTVDRYLDDLEQRYGGIDSVLVWPTYPNIGVDNLNQHEMLHKLPGGLDGVRSFVNDFHRRNVRVLFPVMPWDVGTNTTDESYWQILARDLAYIGADGLNGDTLANVPQVFLEAAHQIGYFPACEPELGVVADEALAWNIASWGYWWPYRFEPIISRAKWIEPRHKVHVTNRWMRDRTDDLQNAFFNGVGYNSWENIWSVWNGLTERDAAALRRIAKIEHFFAEAFCSLDWKPYVPTLQFGIFASCFPTPTQSVWTLINRNDYTIDGPQLTLTFQEDWHCFDLWHGIELKPLTTENGTATFSFEIEARGYGALLVISGDEVSSELKAFLQEMQQLAQTPLSTLSAEWRALPQKLVEIRPTQPSQEPPKEMLLIGGGKYLFEVQGIEIEGEEAIGVDVQYPWEDAPRRRHSQLLDIADFYIDRYPVTNAEFKAFLDATNYKPNDAHNFLRHWQSGSYPEGWGNKPVTWVALEDARAYAAWAGKRLPHEWEWQYAAQGTDKRLYPWGNDWKSTAVPPKETGRSLREPSDVDAFPDGNSRFGVGAMVGNVWQWTDEYFDEHTRTAILRGGSCYYPQGSHWYFPNTYKLNEHGNYLLMSPGRDRAATIGFRCVRDL